MRLPSNIERHESYHGRTTPQIEWRVWNDDHTCYVTFATKRDAFAYATSDLEDRAIKAGVNNEMLSIWRRGRMTDAQLIDLIVK